MHGFLTAALRCNDTNLIIERVGSGSADEAGAGDPFLVLLELDVVCVVLVHASAGPA